MNGILDSKPTDYVMMNTISFPYEIKQYNPSIQWMRTRSFKGRSSICARLYLIIATIVIKKKDNKKILKINMSDENT